MLNTGFKSIDEKLDGLNGGELIAIAESGKSNLILNILHNVAMQEKLNSEKPNQPKKLIYVINQQLILPFPQLFSSLMPDTSLQLEKIEEAKMYVEEFEDLPVVSLGDERFCIRSFKKFMEKIENLEEAQNGLEYSSISAIFVGFTPFTFRYVKTLKEIASHFGVPVIMHLPFSADDNRYNEREHIDNVYQIKKYRDFIDKSLLVYRESRWVSTRIKGTKNSWDTESKEAILDREIEKLQSEGLDLTKKMASVYSEIEELRKNRDGRLIEKLCELEKKRELIGKEIDRLEKEKEELRAWDNKAEIICYRNFNDIPETVKLLYYHKNENHISRFEDLPLG